jgi:tRNA-splicing ligase RtcB
MNERRVQPAIWSAQPLDADVARSVDRICCSDDVQYVAVMPDVHLAHDVCVGAVVATKELIYPAAVGSDIGCGMAVIATDAEAELLQDEQRAAQLLAGLYSEVPSNKHRKRRELPISLVQQQLSCPHLAKLAERDGCVQFGTLGRGNHFLDFEQDEDGRVWVLVHTGSRAMGQAITRHHLANMERNRGLTFCEATSDVGRDYLNDVSWARAYASENRLAMLAAVDGLLHRLFGINLQWGSLIHSDHNHVAHEDHFNETLWVHRKGAQSARDGELAIIPGSMGSPSFHAIGRGEARSLSSCSHGAGRALSRSEARKRINVHALNRQMKDIWFDRRRGLALREEAPAAYKDIRRVMQAQKQLVRIVRELRSVLSYKGS